MTLLFNEPPLVVSPTLAEEIGLNEAIVLQQLHYWLQRSEHFYEGRRWIYNTYTQWLEQFPFWSEKTIKRTITSLESKGYIITGNFNKAGFDRTKWYSIDYDLLNSPKVLVTRRWGQNGPMHRVKMTRPIPETTQRLLQRLLKKEYLPKSNTWSMCR